MSVLVFGTSGQVGIELAALENVRSLSRAQADLSDPEACAQAIRAADGIAVITAAA